MLKKKFIAIVGLLALLVFATTASAAYTLGYIKQTSIPKFVFDNVGATTTDPASTNFLQYQNNPVISGRNLYAPSIVLNGGTWNVYSGGYSTPTDGNDRIYVNTSTNNELTTFNEPSPVLVINNGFYVHVNDASVVRKTPTLWVMALTTFRDYDRISITTSADGVAFSPNTFNDRSHEIHFTNTTSVTQAARPSLNYIADVWYMYFDATVGGVNGQYLATSTENIPVNFTLVGRVGDMYDADIHYVGGKWVAMYRHEVEPRPWRIYLADSTDGITFTERGVILEPDPQNLYNSDSVDNPGMVIDSGGILKAVMFGGSSDGTLTNHKIGIAYPQAKVFARSGAVLHTQSQAFSSTQQVVETYSYNTIDNVQIDIKPWTTIINQSVSATKGAEFSLFGNDPGPIVSGAIYKLINPNSGMALDVSGGGIANGTNVQIWDDNNATPQEWRINSLGDGTYKLVNTSSNRALDVSGAGTANGTNVQIWDDFNGGIAQKWQIIDVGGGSFKLINPNSGRALDVNGAGTTHGTNVQIWDDNGGRAQKWNLIRK